MRYMYKCDKVFKVHIYSLSCKILPIASVMVTDWFLHRECNLWGQYIIQAHPPRNLPSGTWVHIFRVLVVRSLPIASVSSVYQGIDLQYKKHEYGQTLVEYAITWRYGRRPYAVHWYARYGAREPSPVQRSSTDFPDLREIYVQV